MVGHTDARSPGSCVSFTDLALIDFDVASINDFAYKLCEHSSCILTVTVSALDNIS